MQIMGEFFEDVSDEVALAEKKWPEGTFETRVLALTGEVGEVAEGYLKGRSKAELYLELVQVAAMAYRAARVLA